MQALYNISKIAEVRSLNNFILWCKWQYPQNYYLHSERGSVLLSITEQETEILTRYLNRVSEDPCTIFGLPCPCIQARNKF